MSKKSNTVELLFDGRPLPGASSERRKREGKMENLHPALSASMSETRKSVQLMEGGMERIDDRININNSRNSAFRAIK